MKFLKRSESEAPQEQISVNKLYNINIDCLYCNSFESMEGGPVGDGQKAKFLCEKCGKINEIKWGIDND